MIAVGGKPGPPAKQASKNDRQISTSGQRAKSKKKLDTRPRSPHMINDVAMTSLLPNFQYISFPSNLVHKFVKRIQKPKEPHPPGAAYPFFRKI
jgi:hypothetical protein